MTTETSAPAREMSSTDRLAEDVRPMWDAYVAARGQYVSIADMIADLLHLSDRIPDSRDWDVHELLDRARRDYDAEVLGVD
ncbi:hypothetical protein ACIO3O_36980 [Streptomyces sp. NPDC087440]|uniref:hypothetical protein n=1 Tax=Streptomyces sp. NPDC087440 TaxID=3365790 RepID=UPI0037F60B06